MRELKFRVWSEEDREYRTDCDVFRLFHGMTGCPATIYNDEGDRFDIEQYTGIKDKNGKEIYEGDICRCSFGECGVVNYRRGEFCIVGDDIVGMSLWKEKAFDIIGNIHENPELEEGKE